MDLSRRRQNRIGITLVVALALLASGCLPAQVFPTSAEQMPTAALEPTRTQQPVIPAAGLTATPGFTRLADLTAEVTPLPGKLLARLSLGTVEAFALSPGREVLLAASESHACLFETQDWARQWCQATVPAVEMAELEMWSSGARVRGAVFRPDGEQAALALWNGYIVLRDAADGQMARVFATGRWIRQMVWSADGKQILTFSNQGGIEAWDAASGALARQLDAPPESILSAAWSADGALFATADRQNAITIWDAQTWEAQRSFTVETPGWVNSMAWSADQARIYAGIATPMPCEENCDPNDPEYKGWIITISAKSGNLVSKTSVGDIIERLEVSPDGRWLAAGGTLVGSMVVMDTQTSRMQVKLSGTYANQGLGWLDDQRALYLPDPQHADAMSLSEWDTRAVDHREVLLAGYESLRSLAWLPGGERLLTNSAGGTLSLWDARTGQRLEQFSLAVDGALVTDFGPGWVAPRQPWLATGAGGTLAVVDLETHQIVRRLEHAAVGAQVRLLDFTWSADGGRIAGRLAPLDSYGLTAAVWDSQSGALLYRVDPAYVDEIHALALSPDGSQLAISGTLRGPDFQNALTILNVDTGEMVQRMETETIPMWITWLAADELVFDGCDQAQIWYLPLGAPVDSRLPGRFPAVRADGKLAAIPCAGGIGVWGFPNGPEMACLQGQGDRFGYDSLAFSPDGALLASKTQGGSLLVWDTSGYR